jgi:hypothetical protein
MSDLSPLWGKSGSRNSGSSGPSLTQRRHYAYAGGRSPWYDDLLVSFKTKGLFDRREDGLVLCHESGLVAK